MHGNMAHNMFRRGPQPQVIDSSTRITKPDGSLGTATGSIVFDGGSTNTALTSIVQTVEIPITQPATTLTQTTIRTIPVTNSASYSSLLASDSSAKATQAQSASATTSTPTQSSTAAGKPSSSSSNLSTLIPAIVVPVAVILIASFAFFWWMMRRRAKRQAKEEPEFVMASKMEKSAISRGNSGSSGHSSTRELVPMSKLEKEVAVTTSEISRPSADLFPPRYTSTDIGLARPMTPPDKGGAKGADVKSPVRNFSSVRPSTSHKQNREFGSTTPGHGPPPTRSAGRHSPPKSSRGPSPTMRDQMGNQPRRPPRPVNPETRPGARSPPRQAPNPLSTNMSQGKRAPPPAHLNPPTPTGAFNGSSPISQYSPIVKGHPSLNAIAAANSSEQQGQPAPLNTRQMHSASNSADTDSPIDDSILSHENMRIARLANSSRLGLSNSPVEPSFLTGTSTRSDDRNGNARSIPRTREATVRTDPPAISPRLPPPLTREDLPRAPFASARGPDSPGGSSFYPSPSIGAGATPRIGGGPSIVSLPRSDHTIGVASSTGPLPHNDSHGLARRVSVVSRLSSDDGYVDMEFDAKSDVSSLDEREKWEATEDQHVLGYAGSGYGSAGMSPIDGPAGPSSAGTGLSSKVPGSGKPGLRDRDSEGPFVLSRY